MKKAGEDASQDEECDWLMDVGNTRRGAGIFFFFCREKKGDSDEFCFGNTQV